LKSNKKNPFLNKREAKKILANRTLTITFLIGILWIL
jgi:hypothetical protein